MMFHERPTLDSQRVSTPFYNPETNTEVTEHRLPHWHQDQTYCFITWRMGDSLPQSKLKVWRAVRNQWLTHNPKPWSEEQHQEYKETFHKTIDKWLDAGSGSCALMKAGVRDIMIEALHYRDRRDYQLLSYVIMPNHVHVLLCLHSDKDLSKMMKSLKGYTAR